MTLSGYESEEYLQKVASYINNKMNEYGKIESFRKQSVDRQAVLLQLNIADDYFKAKKQISTLEEELAAKDKEMYDLKHELISAQIKLEGAEEQIKALQKDQNQKARELVRLETELKKSERSDKSGKSSRAEKNEKGGGSDMDKKKDRDEKDSRE